MDDYRLLEKQYELPLYPMRDITIVRGKNALVWDSDNREYIDCVGGIGVAAVGHCNDRVIEAIHQQAQRLITCPGIFYNDTRALLLEKLVQITPEGLNRVYLCNSGAEAIEAAIKFTRLSMKKTDFISTVRGFHGRTMGALSATYKPKFREGFEPLVPGFSFVPYNDFEKLREAVTEKTAGIILEVVQGEGGIYIGDAEYFKQVRQLCTEKGVLLIIDEIQTGFCRTGKTFACNHFNLKPDILCVAKAMGGGFPIGATVCSDKVAVSVGKHGTTFGGSPLACAAACAAIDYMIDNKLADQSSEKGKYFINKLKEKTYRMVREVRGIGLMIGIELKEEPKPYIMQLMEKGVLVLPAGQTVIRLLPPLTIEYELLDKVVEVLAETV